MQTLDRSGGLESREVARKVALQMKDELDLKRELVKEAEKVGLDL